MPSTTRFLFLLFFTLVGCRQAFAQGANLSWRDQADRMLGAGNSDSAQYYLEKWLQADPGDESSWYNLACLYALAGKREQALDAWEKSVEAGWSDPDHPLKDSDLESIRSDERFTAALHKVSERKVASGPDGYVRHSLEMRSIGTYIVALPPDYEQSDSEYTLCVILHGSGSTELAHGRLADALGREGVVYIAPRAPYPHSSSFKGSGELGYTAWPSEKLDSLDPLEKQLPLMYADWIMQCIDDARARYRVKPKQVILLGHSQGAAFAYITAARYPEQIRSVFAYAGYFPEEFRSDAYLQGLKENDVRLSIAYGTADNVVDPAESQQITELLDKWKIGHSLKAYDGVGHGIAPEVREQMKEWLSREAGRQ